MDCFFPTACAGISPSSASAATTSPSSAPSAFSKLTGMASSASWIISGPSGTAAGDNPPPPEEAGPTPDAAALEEEDDDVEGTSLGSDLVDVFTRAPRTSRMAMRASGPEPKGRTRGVPARGVPAAARQSVAASRGSVWEA